MFISEEAQRKEEKNRKSRLTRQTKLKVLPVKGEQGYILYDENDPEHQKYKGLTLTRCLGAIAKCKERTIKRSWTRDPSEHCDAEEAKSRHKEQASIRPALSTYGLICNQVLESRGTEHLAAQAATPIDISLQSTQAAPATLSIPTVKPSRLYINAGLELAMLEDTVLQSGILRNTSI